MSQLSEAYVIGLLADLEAEQPKLVSDLGQARERALRVDAELSSLLRRMDEAKADLDALRREIERRATEMGEKNSRIASAHQEIAAIKKRADDLKLEMDRVGPGAVFNRLRRDRAKFLVQVEDREGEITRLRAEVEEARQALTKAEGAQVNEKDKQRLILRELDQLQAQLVSPNLYTRLFDVTAARAHCRLFLDGDPVAWTRHMNDAVGQIRELHDELRAGKYRLDKNSDVVGGRAMASAEALYGTVAMGQLDRARELFSVMTDPSLLFDHIFNVFRVWCLGLYLFGRQKDLTDLLQRHGYAPGLRGGYVQAFSGLLQKDRARVAAGLKAIAKHEWEIWQDPKLVRGAGVVNLGAVAITRLALERGLAVSLPGPTVPDTIIAGKSSR